MGRVAAIGPGGNIAARSGGTSRPRMAGGATVRRSRADPGVIRYVAPAIGETCAGIIGVPDGSRLIRNADEFGV